MVIVSCGQAGSKHPVIYPPCKTSSLAELMKFHFLTCAISLSWEQQSRRRMLYSTELDVVQQHGEVLEAVWAELKMWPASDTDSAGSSRTCPGWHKTAPRRVYTELQGLTAAAAVGFSCTLDNYSTEMNWLIWKIQGGRIHHHIITMTFLYWPFIKCCTLLSDLFTYTLNMSPKCFGNCVENVVHVLKVKLTKQYSGFIIQL